MSILQYHVDPRSDEFTRNRACYQQRLSVLRERLHQAMNGGRERQLDGGTHP